MFFLSRHEPVRTMPHFASLPCGGVVVKLDPVRGVPAVRGLDEGRVDRPFLIVNGTVNFRRPNSFDITQECFEMTRLYSGSRSLGYLDTLDLKATEKPLRIRAAVAISGAALAFHLPGIGENVGGNGPRT